MCICLHHHAGPFGLSHSYNRTPLLFQLLSCQWGCFLGSVLRHKANPTLPHQSGVTHATLLTLLEGFYTNSIKFPYHSVSLCKHAYQFQCGSSHARMSLPGCTCRVLCTLPRNPTHAQKARACELLTRNAIRQCLRILTNLPVQHVHCDWTIYAGQCGGHHKLPDYGYISLPVATSRCCLPTFTPSLVLQIFCLLFVHNQQQ